MEHFGITTVEAMSYGAVPVVIRKGGQMEIVSNGVDGFLWDTEAGCVSKTRALMSDDLLRIKMARAATAKARRFSTDQFQKAVGALFAELIPDVGN
jgi:glycosyltransferase involved in cell wall biosynthesis